MWKHPAFIDHRTVSLPCGKPGKSRKTERGSYPAIPNFFARRWGVFFVEMVIQFDEEDILRYIYNYITNKIWWKIVFLVSQKKGMSATQWDFLVHFG